MPWQPWLQQAWWLYFALAKANKCFRKPKMSLWVDVTLLFHKCSSFFTRRFLYIFGCCGPWYAMAPPAPTGLMAILCTSQSQQVLKISQDTVTEQSWKSAVAHKAYLDATTYFNSKPLLPCLFFSLVFSLLMFFNIRCYLLQILLIRFSINRKIWRN